MKFLMLVCAEEEPDAADVEVVGPVVPQLPRLLHGEERALFGDQAYWAEPDRQAAEAEGIRYRVNRRPTKGHPLTERWKRINHARSRIRARGRAATSSWPATAG